MVTEEHGKLCLMWKCTVAGTTAPSEEIVEEKENDALKKSVDRVSYWSNERGDVLPKEFHCRPPQCYFFQHEQRGAMRKGVFSAELLKVSSISLSLIFWLWE